MSIIENLDPEAFRRYLRKYNNTICGRYPIGIFLQCMSQLKESGYGMTFKFLKYAQSNKCKEKYDSSVSYAAGSVVFNA